MNTIVNETVAFLGDLSDDNCLAIYPTDPSGALAILYNRYGGMLHALAKKFFIFSREDVDSIAWMALDKAVTSFSGSKAAKFPTWLTAIMRNALRNEYRALKVKSVCRDWYVEVTFEGLATAEIDDAPNVFNLIGVDEDYSKVDIENSIETLPLTANQYAYVEWIIRNGADASDAEVARELGLSRATVGAIKKSLAKKLENFIG